MCLRVKEFYLNHKTEGKPTKMFKVVVHEMLYDYYGRACITYVAPFYLQRYDVGYVYDEQQSAGVEKFCYHLTSGFFHGLLDLRDCVDYMEELMVMRPTAVFDIIECEIPPEANVAVGECYYTGPVYSTAVATDKLKVTRVVPLKEYVDWTYKRGE